MSEYYYIGVKMNATATPCIIGTRNYKKALRIYNVNVNALAYLVELFTYSTLLKSSK